jgi:hypothetical protein
MGFNLAFKGLMLQIQTPVEPPQNSDISIRWGVPDFDIRSTARHRNSSGWYHNTLQGFARSTGDGTKKQFYGRLQRTMQFVWATRYKPEDRRFDSRWCH